MTFKVKEHRNIFIDSRAGTQNNHKSQIHLPTQSFNCLGDELMRITLNSFSMRRNFYKINETNNTFYGVDVANSSTLYEVKITEGDYNNFDDLATAIQTAIRATFGGTPTCQYDEQVRAFTFNMATSASNWDSTDGYFTSFLDKNSTDKEKFNDAHEILGGRAEEDATKTSGFVNMFGTSTGDDHVSIFPAQLDTIADLFLTTNLQTNNFETHGFRRGTTGENTITNSQKFARIPIERDLAIFNTSNYCPTLHDIIKFEDSNDLYSIYLQNKQLTQVIFDIEDEKGRPIPRVQTGQFAAGNLHYKMVLKWEVLEHPDKVVGRPSGDLEGKYKGAINN